MFLILFFAFLEVFEGIQSKTKGLIFFDNNIEIAAYAAKPEPITTIEYFFFVNFL